MERTERFREDEQEIFAGDPVEIRWGPYGRYLVAKTPIKKGQVVWKEVPCAAIQSLPNTRELECCARCFRAIGTFENQMRLALSEYEDHVDLPVLIDPTGQDEHVLTNLVPCATGCGIKYCSLACADAHAKEGHLLLCVGPLSSADHPLVRFKQFAIEHNEIFLLAGQIVARVLMELANGERAEAATLDAMIWPYSLLMRQPWSECVVYAGDMAPEDRDQPELQEYCSQLPPRQLQQQAAELHALVTQALSSPEVVSRHVGMAAAVGRLLPQLDVRFFEELIGLFEINCSAISFFGPALTVLRNKKLPEADRLRAQTTLFEAVLEEDETGPEELTQDSIVDLSQLLPSFDGIAVFHRISVMQHSCVPNIINKFGTNHEASVTAMRDIAAGEELVHSYIEHVQEYAMRTKILQLWGFKDGCHCLACQEKRDVETVDESSSESESE